uniref:SH3 domain-containing protein n=1 Tax=Periophthalmus magnuspinnatus TaxID=409849 RepID=A0A3B4B9L3_9GOBI
MYLVSVLWSDQNEIVVYRTFRDFQKLHVISILANLLISLKLCIKKTPTKYLVRLKFLQTYCNELLSCEPRVCQCTDLVTFFHPNEQDLQPEFSNSSVIVMPLDEDLKADLGGGNVTKPFVTETYCCVAAYETKDTKNKPFKVAAEEKVDVLIKDKAGWWLVENDEKRMAWFPAPYLEKLEHDGMLYIAIKSYKATKDDEITVSISAVVEVLKKPENGWWLVRYKEKAGYIPSIYLRPYYPHICLTPSLPEQQYPLNLLETPSSRPSSPCLLQPESKKKSRSLNILPALLPTQLPVVPASHVTNGSVHHHPPPTITIERDDNDEGRSVNIYKDGSRFSHTPPPPRSNHLIPPRPQPQQILTRCTTITRKNAAKGHNI